MHTLLSARLLRPMQPMLIRPAFKSILTSTTGGQTYQFVPLQDPSVIDQAIDLGMDEDGELKMKGRNSRRPKVANHGARPCSSYMRKLK